MQLEEYLDVQGPDVVRIKGHRIGLEHIVERYQEGFSPEEIALDFPGLSLEKIYAVIAYYLRHTQEIEEYMAKRQKRGEEVRKRIEAGQKDLTEIRARLKARRGN